MAIYAVGDIQGCYDALRRLLDKINFDSTRDQLWAVGDLVNRGPQSLETLQFCHDLGSSFLTVLGNHDLHLLAIASGQESPRKSDTLDEILKAPDRDELLHWLQNQPLFHYDSQLGVAMVHAGIPPQWDLEKTMSLAAEVETVLRSEQSDTYFSQMYGNQPDLWDDDLSGSDRLRLITNYLTRMRFCSTEGRLELSTKLGPEAAPAGYFPWFALTKRKVTEVPIIFGHWASLMGHTEQSNLVALDTGCVWGGQLTVAEITNHFKRTFVEAK
jgi:bis(5'-nucleosyl)-tetraphosphatase (symmetrical)